MTIWLALPYAIKPGQRTASSHAVAARVVDDDEIDAAGLFAFGRQAGAGASADDGLAAGDHAAKLVENRLAGDAWHGLL